MKKNSVLLVFALLIFISSDLVAQRSFCDRFLKSEDCWVSAGRGFKIDRQSRSTVIGIEDKLIFNIVLYSGMQYKINFCSSVLFKPVHFVLMDAESGRVMYDNSDHELLDNLTLNILKTQRIKVAVNVLGSEMTEKEKLEFIGCLGILLHAKKIS